MKTLSPAVLFVVVLALLPLAAESDIDIENIESVVLNGDAGVSFTVGLTGNPNTERVCITLWEDATYYYVTAGAVTAQGSFSIPLGIYSHERFGQKVTISVRARGGNNWNVSWMINGETILRWIFPMSNWPEGAWQEQSYHRTGNPEGALIFGLSHFDNR